MSVGRQFKRIGEIGVALALWRGVFWVFGRPRRECSMNYPRFYQLYIDKKSN